MALPRKRKKAGGRRHFRYTDRDYNNVKVFYHTLNSKKIFFNALVINESYSGIACVFIGNQPFKKDQDIFWQETKKLTIQCRVARCRKIEKGVYFLGLDIKT